MATTEGCAWRVSSATSHQHAVSAPQYSGSLQGILIALLPVV